MGLAPLPEQVAVAVVIPARDAADTLARAVASAQRQDGVEEIAIAVADGATAGEAQRLAVSDPRVRVVPNPSRRTPDALNAAIAATSAEVVVRLDAHAELPDGYVRTAVRALRETGAANVGGRQVPVGDSPLQRAVALAMASPAGSGGAAYRSGRSAGPVDTVYLGVFRREALERVGGFDTRFTRNQDAELNLRLRNAELDVWFEPDLAVRYAPRASLRALARQYHEYGRWRRLTAQVHRGSAQLRQLAPPALVLGLAASVVVSLLVWNPLPAVAALIAYLGGVAVAGAAAARCSRLTPLVAAALATMHLAWGLGFLVGPPRGIDGTDPTNPPPGR